MGVIIGMFTQLARLGVTRAAAFFYAVAVGVVANVVIAHFSPHPGDAPADAQPAVAKSSDTPVATALIAPKPALPSVQTLDISAPATTTALPAAAPAVPAVAAAVATATAVSAPTPAKPPAPDASASAFL